jgi:hypothetical protein
MNRRARRGLPAASNSGRRGAREEGDVGEIDLNLQLIFINPNCWAFIGQS